MLNHNSLIVSFVVKAPVCIINLESRKDRKSRVVNERTLGVSST